MLSQQLQSEAGQTGPRHPCQLCDLTRLETQEATFPCVQTRGRSCDVCRKIDLEEPFDAQNLTPFKGKSCLFLFVRALHHIEHMFDGKGGFIQTKSLISHHGDDLGL